MYLRAGRHQGVSDLDGYISDVYRALTAVRHYSCVVDLVFTNGDGPAHLTYNRVLGKYPADRTQSGSVVAESS
jgi:hypothetical protein